MASSAQDASGYGSKYLVIILASFFWLNIHRESQLVNLKGGGKFRKM